MSFDWVLFLSAFATLVVIVDPIGNLPIFISLTSKMSLHRRHQAALTSNGIALFILLVFGFFGQALFNAMNITTEALEISGGLLLLIVAMQLLTGEEEDPGKQGGSLSVAAVPLGTPLLAGPGGIVAFMLLVQNADGELKSIIAVTLGLTLVLAISVFAMYFASPIMKFLGNAGIALLTKLSGMLLAAIAVQLIISGVVPVLSQVR